MRESALAIRVLGGILRDLGNYQAYAQGRLTPDHFPDGPERDLYEKIEEVAARHHGSVDDAVVMAAVREDPQCRFEPDRVLGLADQVPSSAMLHVWISDLAREAAAREEERLRRKAQAALEDGDTGLALQLLEKAAHGRQEAADEPLEEGGDSFLEDMEPDPPALVEKLIPEGGKVLLVGGAKVGKTALLLNLAWCVAAGIPFLGRATHRPRRVLMVDLELSRRGMQERIAKMRATTGLAVPDTLRLTLLRGHPQYRDWTRLRSLIERMHREHGPYDLITIDCLYRLQPGADENEASSMSRVGVELDRIHASTGAATAVLHHTGKPQGQQQDPVNMGRGSSVLGGEMDTILAVQPHVEEHHAILRAEARDFPRPGPAVYSLRKWPAAHLCLGKEAEVRKPGVDPIPASDDTEAIRVGDPFTSPW